MIELIRVQGKLFGVAIAVSYVAMVTNFATTNSLLCRQCDIYRVYETSGVDRVSKVGIMGVQILLLLPLS